MGATEEPIRLVGESARVPVAIDQRVTESLQADDRLVQQQHRAFLDVEDIEAERNPGAVYGVYVNLPEEPTADDLAAHHVGNVSLFGVERARNPRGDEHAHGLHISMEITDVLDRLAAEGNWQDGQRLDVTFRPISLVEPSADAPAARDRAAGTSRLPDHDRPRERSLRLMATVQGELGHQRLEVRRWLLRHPESVAAILVGVAWLWLVSIELRGASAGGHAGMAMMQGMPGMDMAPETPRLPGIANPIGWWVLMSVAMMGPGALAGVRHTGLNSLRWRRGRAMAGFAAAYLAVWAIFGSVALTVVAALPGAPGTAALVIVLALAAGWQLTPLKRRWLRDCHRSVPLPPRGWKAELGALRFGLRNGLDCLGSCWCLMLVMAVVPAHHLVWMLALTVVVTAEKLMERPRYLTRMAAAALAITAVVVVGLTLA